MRKNRVFLLGKNNCNESKSCAVFYVKAPCFSRRQGLLPRRNKPDERNKEGEIDMKTKRTLIALTLCATMLFSIGCAARSAAQNDAVYYSEAASGSSYDMAAVAPQSEAAVYSEKTASDTTAATEEQQGDFDVRKIVYNADMAITADDPGATLEALIAKTEALGGYVSGSYATTDDEGTTYANATLKVPSAMLEELVTTANELGKVDSYRLNSDDISLSYYDLQARLDNAKAEETQLLDILARCETIEDILAVRQSLTSVRADIESYTAQINLWDNLVAYATLSVTINRTPKTAVEGEKDLIQLWKASDVWDKMARGFQNSARFVVNALGAIGIFLAIAAIPAGVLFLIIGLPIIAHKKKKRKKAAALKAQMASSPEPDDTVKQNE